MYYVFFNIHIYCIQKNTSGLQHCLGRVTFREGFLTNLKDFKTILSLQTIFYTLIYTCKFSYFIMFSTSRCSKLETFIVYSVCSLSMLYTHFPHFHPFQVRYCQALLPLLLLHIVVELLVFFSIEGGFFFLLIHQTDFINLFVLNVILFSFMIIHMYYLFESI